MKAENFDVRQLLTMRHSPVRNYVLPGLTSWLIGEPSKSGAMRLFECQRDHQESITPHSHRFDFQCWVLEGAVRNRLWASSYPSDREADEWRSSTLHYEGEIGQYRIEPGEVSRYRPRDEAYAAGECYGMKAHQIHSIFFSRGTRVLFFEGPTVADTSVILEPWVSGEAIPTLEVKPWMFKKATGA